MYSESDSASASEGETSYMESVTVEAQKSRPKRDVRPSRKVREQEQRNEPGGIQAAATDGKHDSKLRLYVSDLGAIEYSYVYIVTSCH